MVLLRHLLGDVLRRLRQRQGRTLREVSAAARVSLGYLSEVERGQKEASSELLAAICDALNTPLSRVLGEVSDSFALAELQNEAAALTPAAGEPAAAPAKRDLALPVGRSFAVEVSPELHVPAGHARGLDSGDVLRPVGVNPGHPAFDEVTRRIRDVTDMVPV
jgi:XRE family transcriptional regulator, stress-response regulator